MPNTTNHDRGTPPSTSLLRRRSDALLANLRLAGPVNLLFPEQDGFLDTAQLVPLQVIVVRLGFSGQERGNTGHARGQSVYEFHAANNTRDVGHVTFGALSRPPELHLPFRCYEMNSRTRDLAASLTAT